MTIGRSIGSSALHYGRTWADIYDSLYETRDDLDGVIKFVEALSLPSRSVLELGVGTGRLAIPLANAGFDVCGVDSSSEMLARMNERPGSDLVESLQADMVDVDPGRMFGAALVAFSTLYLLPDAETQLRCIENAVRHIMGDGVLIIEAFPMDANRWHNGTSISVSKWTDNEIEVNVGMLNQVDQIIETASISVREDDSTIRRNRLRYTTMSELDLMAKMAGCEFTLRTADLAGKKFDSTCSNAVSVYRRKR